MEICPLFPNRLNSQIKRSKLASGKLVAGIWEGDISVHFHLRTYSVIVSSVTASCSLTSWCLSPAEVFACRSPSKCAQFTLLHYIYVHKLTYQLIHVTLSKYTQEGRKKHQSPFFTQLIHYIQCVLGQIIIFSVVLSGQSLWKIALLHPWKFSPGSWGGSGGRMKKGPIKMLGMFEERAQGLHLRSGPVLAAQQEPQLMRLDSGL